MWQDRYEHIHKHGFTKAHDLNTGVNKELANVALYLIATHLKHPDAEQFWPAKWNVVWKKRYDSKTDLKKLSEAGALLAAEIDRIYGGCSFMLNGIDFMISERSEQIMKHGFTIEHDKTSGTDGMLAESSFYLVKKYLNHQDNDQHWPASWSKECKEKFDSKNEIKTLTVAGSLLAARFDLVRRLSHIN